MKNLRLLFLSAVLAFVAHTGVASATCNIYGDITATQSQPGQWTYCIDFSYQILDPLAQVSVFLPECAQGCRPDLITFPNPTGTLSGITGTGDSCDVELDGHFYCDRDPALNAPNAPTITWTPSNLATCTPTTPGVGHICFTLNVAPADPREQTNAITILTTNGQCWGTLKGVFPGCNPPTPARTVTWGDIKGGARYDQ